MNSFPACASEAILRLMSPANQYHPDTKLFSYFMVMYSVAYHNDLTCGLPESGN